MNEVIGPDVKLRLGIGKVHEWVIIAAKTDQYKIPESRCIDSCHDVCEQSDRNERSKPHVAGADTGPIPAASTSALSNLSTMASIPKCSRARARARSAKAYRSDGDRPAISTRAAAQPCAEGARSHPVHSPGASTTLSVGPPLSHASTGSPEDIASTGTIPKCSFAGV